MDTVTYAYESYEDALEDGWIDEEDWADEWHDMIPYQDAGVRYAERASDAFEDSLEEVEDYRAPYVRPNMGAYVPPARWSTEEPRLDLASLWLPFGWMFSSDATWRGNEDTIAIDDLVIESCDSIANASGLWG